MLGVDEKNFKNNLDKHLRNIYSKIIDSTTKSNKRYIAYIIKSEQGLLKNEEFDFRVEYKYFDDINCISLLEYMGYTVIDTHNETIC